LSEFRERALHLMRSRGAIRPRDLDLHGIPRYYLQLLHASGAADRVGRGLYVPTDAAVSEHHSLAEASVRTPNGIVSLLSALRFHGLTTQIPFQVWIAIEEKSWAPRISHPPLRIVRFSGTAWSYGVEQHVIEGVPIRVYSPAKTVADCFKYRNKIGIDVAVEALRETLRHRRATPDELMAAAATCRMTRVITPYLQALA